MQFLIFFVELILAIKIRTNEKVIPMMRIFYWYPLIGIFVTFFILFQYYNKVFSNVAFCINLCSLLFHYLFLSYFILNSVYRRRYFKTIIWILFVFISVLISSSILNKHFDSIAFTNSCLFFFSLFYFFSIYKGDISGQLLNNPIFYVCSGVLIGTGLIVPAAIMFKYSIVLDLGYDLRKFVIEVSLFGYIIMNLFFIKALLCSNKE